MDKDDLLKHSMCLEFIGFDIGDEKYHRHMAQALRRALLKKSNVKQFFVKYMTFDKNNKLVYTNEKGKIIRNSWTELGKIVECEEEVEVVFGNVEELVTKKFLSISDDDKIVLSEKELGGKLISNDCVKYFVFDDKGRLAKDNYENYKNAIKYDKYLQERIKYDEFYHHLVYQNHFMTDADITDIYCYISRVYNLTNINYLTKLVRDENHQMYEHYNSLQDAVLEDIEEFEYEKDEEGNNISYIDNFFEKVCGKVPEDEDSAIYQRELARMIFYGIVARAFNTDQRGVKFDYVPIFESSQGRGKSSLVNMLNILPSTYDVVDSFDGRDAMLHLNGKCFMEIAELQAMNKAKDNETIKKFVTKASDTFRLPYGKADITYVRTCIFIGTTNDASFLTDITGNRRYLPINLDTMSYDMVTSQYAKDYIKKCWQEAYLLMQEGKIYLNLPSECFEIVEKFTNMYIVDDPLEGIIKDYVEKYDSQKRSRDDAVCGVEIFTHCMNGLRNNYGKNDARTIAYYMKSLPGWKRYPGKLRFGDYGLQRCWVNENYKQ